MGPWGPFGSFLGKKCLFWDKFAKKIKIFELFKACFSPVGLKNIIDIQRKKITNKNLLKRFSKPSKITIFDRKSDFFGKNTHKIVTNCPRDLNLGLK